MPMTTAEYEVLLRNIGPVINEAFYGAFETVPDVLNDLFDVRTTTRSLEKFSGAGGLGLMPIFDGARNYDQPELLWAKSLTWLEYDIAVNIARTLLEDLDTVGTTELEGRAYGLGLAAAKTRQYLAVQYYENGATGTFTYDGRTFNAQTPDGIALFSASHPYTPTNASTQSNYTTAAFSYENLKAARQMMAAFKDPRALPALVQPDTILFGPAIADDVYAVLYSDKRPDNANNEINVVRNGLFSRGLRPIETAWITGNHWFLIDSSLRRLGAKWFNRSTTELEEDYNFNSRTFARAAHERHGAGFIDWRFAVGNFAS